MKPSVRFLAVILLCAVASYAAALSQPIGQTVEIVNFCPHDVTIRVKGMFNPWRKMFHRKFLASGGRIRKTQYFCSLFSCKEKQLPEWVFNSGDGTKLPYETVSLQNSGQPWYKQVLVCPENRHRQTGY